MKVLASVVASAMAAWSNNFNKLDEATKFAQVKFAEFTEFLSNFSLNLAKNPLTLLFSQTILSTEDSTVIT